MNHQQQQPMQHQTRPSSLVGNSFGLGGANITLNNNNNNNNNNNSTAASILSGSPLSQLSSQSHQLQLFQQQQQQLQQQHKVQSPQQSVLSSSPPSGLLQSQHHLHNQHHQQQQQQQQLKRSMSSTSSPVPSPTSSGSQQHLLHHQQPEHHQQQHHQHHHHHQQQHHQHHQQHHHYQHSMHSGGDPTYHFKILVPAVASGAIIGKGGETIASLQKDSGGRVKMSKSHDFYPGTNERVCLISGSSDAIMTVLDFIMDKIREKPDLSTKIIDTEAKQAQERDKQVKILVPNSTAGMIIGKAGAYIKQIKEESGSYVQISQKPKDITLQERCITIIGEKENNKSACKLILSKIIEDPQSGSCLNVSYADINGPVANYNPTGSPYATNQTSIGASNATLNSSVGNAASAAGLLVNGSGINLSLNLSSPNPTPNIALATQLLEHIKPFLSYYYQVAMRGSGYSETVTNDVCNALGVLAKYGVLGVGVGVPHQNGAHSAPVYNVGVSALEQSAAAATANSVFNAVGHVNLEQYIGQSTAAAAAAAARHSSLESVAAAAQYDPFRHGSQAATPISINNNSFGLAANAATAHQLSAAAHQTLGALSKSPTPGDLGAKDAKNVEVPDMIVGAILGPNGRTLVEIQHVSGANVQISKKGIFAPGTRNRIVTVTGQPNAIAMAQYLIEQKISEEEAKRARQNPIINNDEE